MWTVLIVQIYCISILITNSLSKNLSIVIYHPEKLVLERCWFSGCYTRSNYIASEESRGPFLGRIHGMPWPQIGSLNVSGSCLPIFRWLYYINIDIPYLHNKQESKLSCLDFGLWGHDIPWIRPKVRPLYCRSKKQEFRTQLMNKLRVLHYSSKRLECTMQHIHELLIMQMASQALSRLMQRATHALLIMQMHGASCIIPLAAQDPHPMQLVRVKHAFA